VFDSIQFCRNAHVASFCGSKGLDAKETGASISIDMAGMCDSIGLRLNGEEEVKECMGSVDVLAHQKTSRQEICQPKISDEESSPVRGISFDSIH